MSFDDEAAGGSFKLYLEDGGCGVMSERQSKKQTEQVNHAVQSILQFVRFILVMPGVRSLDFLLRRASQR